MSPARITPHGATRVEVRVGGTTLAALRAEPVNPAGAAVLVPGYTGSKEDFAALLDPLRSAGLSVLAVDMPGQYESGGPDREDEYLPDPLGRTLAALVTDLACGGRHRVLLLGHSYGGLVSRSAVIAGAPVTGLTLLGSGPGALPSGPRRAVIDATEPVLRAEGIEVVQRLLETRDGIAEPPELAALLRARFLGSATAGLLGMATGLRTEPDRVTELATALRTGGIPCLVAFGEFDDAWPVPVQREMALRLGAEIAVVPGAAHSPAIENPGALLDALLPIWRRWLTAAEAS